MKNKIKEALESALARYRKTTDYIMSLDDYDENQCKEAIYGCNDIKQALTTLTQSPPVGDNGLAGCREAFEKFDWAAYPPYDHRKNEAGNYLVESRQRMWEVWQAAWKTRATLAKGVGEEKMVLGRLRAWPIEHDKGDFLGVLVDLEELKKAMVEKS